MEEYQFSQGKNLRCGYTTGSCATAAAKAAARMLLTGERVDTVRIDTPKGIVLDLEPLEVEITAAYASCAIRKDSGDDPDDTHGILVYARVEKCAEPGVTIEGGVGVGRVTKPGLACQVGGPAINPTPRRMITAEVRQVMEQEGYKGGLLVTISMPAGVEIAKKTFNPRLGIIGGLSVLGTSGIVEPMSEKALIETMYVEIKAQQARGNKNLLVFFGNYGEDFTRDIMHLDLEGAVTCSNFVGELLDYAVFCGFETLLLIGHSGKLVKLAQGVMNTHSKYADCRTELFALEAMFHGASVEVGKEIYGCLTTDEVTKILQREHLFEPVIEKVTEKIDFYMQHRVHGKIKTAALMFSNVYGILGKTKYADDLIQLHKQKGECE
ncbi:MAG: cobalt-precorrin-5B (C(1))-methyltransferase CbiD [Phascolarctobacterium sp.]|uniref:cobalt-precorrin-5B (C(1))-methyltransferase CbiD n=1 Tax=Phascolarctobacterium sp. TaxID=2049039 RepID=UPI0026DCAD3D|nr:cobalt-precorrin-5B (C(1))-methyltransferase CbiD [Phascolarctobacterium sp.]MDO4921182.1 cobalt-precorrin-5B (C(1))-methyltransferase CbiD [Phascolarctobacterium sp.]